MTLSLKKIFKCLAVYGFGHIYGYGRHTYPMKKDQRSCKRSPNNRQFQTNMTLPLKKIFKCLAIYGYGGHLSHMTETILSIYGRELYLS